MEWKKSGNKREATQGVTEKKENLPLQCHVCPSTNGLQPLSMCANGSQQHTNKDIKGTNGVESE